jgi:hypothetical protein
MAHYFFNLTNDILRVVDADGVQLEDEKAMLSFPKILSARIRAMRENQSIIRRDACHPPSAWNVRRQPVQVAAPA